MIDSSTYPFPPRHSRASATTGIARLQAQYLLTARARRRKRASSLSAARSRAPASRIMRMVVASDSMARSARTLRIKGSSMSRMVSRLRDGLAHQRRGADDAVEACVVDHLDDGPHSLPCFADQPRERAIKLDLARGVGAIAELVFQTLDVEGVAGAIGEDARQQEAGQAARSLGEHQEGVAHRRRTEPLVPRQLELAAGSRRGARRVGADV